LNFFPKFQKNLLNRFMKAAPRALCHVFGDN
jgi:hypothetical protein